jgi:hypothetical protein
MVIVRLIPWGWGGGGGGAYLKGSMHPVTRAVGIRISHT